MAATHLLNTINDALDRPSWDDSIAGVKTAVRNAILSMDRRVEIRDTGYFNHSFVPDFSLLWPSTQFCRDLFLRLDSSPSFLAGDLKFLGSSEPILMGISGGLGGDDRESIASSVEEGNTLIVDPVSVDELASSGSTELGQVVPAALLKGGRGLVGAPEADAISGGSSAFFESARGHQAEALSSAVAVITPFLGEAETSRLVNFARIVWEATGGDPTAFPLLTSLSGVDDEALRFLLEEGPPGDASFWRSVGHLVRLERLIGLGVGEAPNLRSLVAANLDRLHGRAMLVKGQASLTDSAPSWAIEKGALAYRGSDFVALIGVRRDDIDSAPDEAPPLDLKEFRQRLSGHLVESVAIAAPAGKTVTIDSDQGFDANNDVILDAVAEHSATGVRRVGLNLTGRTMHLRFEERSAAGQTNAQFGVLEFLQTALPVLWPLRDEDSHELEEVATVASELTHEPSLFDLLDDDGQSGADSLAENLDQTAGSRQGHAGHFEPPNDEGPGAGNTG